MEFEILVLRGICLILAIICDGKADYMIARYQFEDDAEAFAKALSAERGQG